MNAPVLLLYYDEFHTPLDALVEPLADLAAVVVVDIRLDEDHPPLRVNGLPPRWRVEHVDARERFCREYLARSIKANARYQAGYLLSAALSRPLMAEVCSECLPKDGPATIIHGFAGNDQLRFEAGIRVLRPETELRPVAMIVGSRSRANDGRYTTSANLWGRSVEAGPLGDPWQVPPTDAFLRVRSPEDCGARTERHTLGFRAGLPVDLDGEALPLPALLAELNHLGRCFAFGFTDLVEDGCVGLKTRALYEQPGAAVALAAHADLERFVCSRSQNHFKPLVDQAWAELVYDGRWWDPQREALDAYIDAVEAWVTGDVQLLFLPGGVHVVGRRSPHALYDEKMAVYRAGDEFGAHGVSSVAELHALDMAIARKRRPDRQGGA